jgi:hypothetical protein
VYAKCLNPDGDFKSICEGLHLVSFFCIPVAF